MFSALVYQEIKDQLIGKPIHYLYLQHKLIQSDNEQYVKYCRAVKFDEVKKYGLRLMPIFYNCQEGCAIFKTCQVD